MNKYHIFVIVLFGFLLMPSKTFACGNSSGKNSCKKEVSSKTDKGNCCKGDDNSKDKKPSGCGGKCGHSNCTTSTFSTEKPRFYHSETFISSGFTSVWLPPKIK
jgi:hypothetical protein